MGIQVTLVSPLGRFIVGGMGRDENLAFAETRPWWESYRMANIVHINYAFASLPIILNPSSRSIPLIYTVHGVPLPEFESMPAFKVGYVLERMTLRHLAQKATSVIAISSFVHDLLTREYGVDSKVIHNGVETELFCPPDARVRRSLRSYRGFSEDDCLVLFVGRLHPVKDPLTFVRCIPKVLGRNRTARFVMIGQGEMTNAVMREASRAGVNGSFKLIDHVDRSELVEWYQAADFFVSTAPREMFGIAVLEAMSTGLPVIAAASGAPLEVLGDSGTFFGAGDYQDLADKLCALIEAPNTSHEKGEAAREKVLRYFRWELVAERYASVYREALFH